MTTDLCVYSTDLLGGVLESRIARFRAQGRPLFGKAVRVWVSGALARPFLVGPVAGLDGWRESTQAAAAMAPAACGIAGPCSVVLESDPTSESAFCSAIETAVLDRLRVAAASQHLRVRSIRPVWASAIDSSDVLDTADALLCCKEASVLTVLAFKAGAAIFAATYPTAAAQEETALLGRLTASLTLEIPEVRYAEIDEGDRDAAPVWRWNSSATRA